LTVFVSSSPQRRQFFKQLQIDDRAPSTLTLIQDVATRWDSTCHMLVRALKLQRTIDSFTRSFPKAVCFSLDPSEWKQVQYLIDLTIPFNFFTTNIGRSLDPTIYHAFSIYDQLFDHLDRFKRLLLLKSYPWVDDLNNAIDAATEKLHKYYSKSYANLGTFYGLGTILAPEHKTSIFGKTSWLKDSA
jgi:hypothetical protein